VAIDTLTNLVSDLDRMLTYDIIFIPCSGSSNTAALQDENVLRNIRDFVAAGGKLYVTDWSGEWSDNVFPAQVELDGFADTPASAYDPISDTWNSSEFGTANGFPSYTSEMAEAVNDDLALWLEGQSGPLAEGGQGAFIASDMTIEGNWNHIVGLHQVEVGVDEFGMTILDQPAKYVIGDDAPLARRNR
jgi:hypothetical protein